MTKVVTWATLLIGPVHVILQLVASIPFRIGMESPALAEDEVKLHRAVRGSTISPRGLRQAEVARHGGGDGPVRILR